jgi:flagellar basal-body rod modification protein FlgD
MSITSLTDTSYWKTPTSTEKTSTTGTSSLDFDSFLQLLATELQYQDPTDPVSNTEYISQMAQMSSLLQVQNISASIEASQAYSMIGKTVTYEVVDSTGAATAASGTVQSVITSSDGVYLKIDDALVNLSSVVMVSDS